MTTKIFIPVICYNHSANTEYMMSLIGLTHYLKDKGIGYELYPIFFESLVCRARNAAVANFLDSDCTHLLFIDSDIEFNPQSVTKLLLHNKDVICGLYPKKYFVMERLEKNQEIVDFPLAGEVVFNAEGLLDSTYLPTGFLLIKREVFSKMIKEYPELHYENDISGYGNSEFFYNFFQVSVRNGILESEDWGFCSLWKAVGGQVFVDPTIELGHIGLVRYSGNPYKWVQEAIERNSNEN